MIRGTAARGSLESSGIGVPEELDSTSFSHAFLDGEEVEGRRTRMPTMF